MQDAHGIAPRKVNSRIRSQVSEDWEIFNQEIRRKVGLPREAPPPPPRLDPEILVRARARNTKIRGTCFLLLTIAVTVLICVYAFKWTPAITAKDIALPSLRIDPKDMSELKDLKLALTPGQPPGHTNDATVVTNYVVFQNVAFANGVVVTGWRYSSNTDRTPNSQYCYFEVRNEAGVAQVAFLERADRKRLPHPGREAANGLSSSDWQEAFSRCKWAS